MLTFDIVRLCINIGLAAICVGINVKNIVSQIKNPSKNQNLSSEIGGAFVELIILFNFSI
jgi:hypothetical protein